MINAARNFMGLTPRIFDTPIWDPGHTTTQIKVATFPGKPCIIFTNSNTITSVAQMKVSVQKGHESPIHNLSKCHVLSFSTGIQS